MLYYVYNFQHQHSGVDTTRMYADKRIAVPPQRTRRRRRRRHSRTAHYMRPIPRRFPGCDHPSGERHVLLSHGQSRSRNQRNTSRRHVEAASRHNNLVCTLQLFPRQPPRLQVPACSCGSTTSAHPTGSRAPALTSTPPGARPERPRDTFRSSHGPSCSRNHCHTSRHPA